MHRSTDPLEVEPESEPIASDVVALKPDVQNQITSTAGSKNIRIYIPPYLNHTLMSQSYLTFDLTVSGRGAPIPTSSAASLFQTVRVHDGTGAHLIEETLQYGCFVKNMFDVTSTQTHDNQRAFFEGSQPNKSISDNLYYGNPSSWYGGQSITAPNVSKQVQISMPLHTHFLSSPSFLPVGTMQGLRIELLTDDYRRALNYTTGSLMVELAGACTSLFSIPLNNTTFPAIVGPPAFSATPLLAITTPGTAFTGTVAAPQYVRSTVAASISGAVGVFEITGVSGTGAITAITLYSTGTLAPDESNTACFQPGDVVTIPGATAADNATITFSNNVNCMGAGRKSNAKVEFEMVISTPTELDYLATDANTGSDGAFGTNTLLDPFRGVPAYIAAYEKPFPEDISPVEVGDQLFISNNDGTNEKALGLVTGLTSSGTGRYTIKFSPNIATSPDAAGGATIGITGYHHNVVSGNAVRKGLSVFIKSSDRTRGYSGGLNLLAAAFPTATTAAGITTKFEIANMQYQVKRVFLDPKAVQREVSQANSKGGLMIEVPSLFSQLVNSLKLVGPSSQLIALPQLTKCNSILSFPLDQSKQYDLRFDAFAGVVDDAEDYQYMIGDSVHPQRPVDLDGCSGTNPLWSVQHLMEYIKAYESAGYFPTNVNRIGDNFVYGRAFAKKNHYFNLMESGDLSLKIRFGSDAKLDKLFVHYISHIRSILINSDGMQIFN